MPTFVPVVDNEKSRSERDDNDASLAKHRKFDNPFALAKPSVNPSNKRGFETGSVGWGVLGSFGSNQKDDGTHANLSRGKSKLIKNSAGLWVKASDEHEPRTGGRGRGGGISVFGHSDAHMGDSENSRSHSRSHSRSRSRSRSRDRNDAQRKEYDSRRWRSKSRSRSRNRFDKMPHDSRKRGRERVRSRERERDRDRDKDRDKDRGGDRERDREGERERGGDRDRDKERGGDRDRDKDRGGERERGRDRGDAAQHGVDRDILRNVSTEKEVLGNQNSDIRYGGHEKDPAVENTKAGFGQAEVIDNNQNISTTDQPTEDFFNFNAIQVVNRLLEVFAKDSKFRLDELEEVFAQDAVICSLKSGKVILSGREKIRASFSTTLPHSCNCARRIFINCQNGASFCFDLHPTGESPGLGDPKKETFLLYRCCKSVITNVWGGVDKYNMSTKSHLTLSEITGSDIWPLVTQIIRNDDPDMKEEILIFHDYTDIEVWG